MKWTKEKIKYIVSHYKKKGDGLKLAKKFKVKPFVIRDIVAKLRKEGVKIPDISITSGKNKSIREAVEDIRKIK